LQVIIPGTTVQAVISVVAKNRSVVVITVNHIIPVFTMQGVVTGTAQNRIVAFFSINRVIAR
jgi:hypothetical protein